MDQDLDQFPTSLREPMACSEPSVAQRDDAFKALLLTLSHNLNQNNPSELAFAAGCNLSGSSLQPLDVLRQLRRQGVFSPTSCAKLEEHLRKIYRCDLADMVREYMDDHPDLDPDPPSGKRELLAKLRTYRRVAHEWLIFLYTARILRWTCTHTLTV